MDRPDIVFIVLDSVRCDRLSTYGAIRNTAPALDEFSSQSLKFENAYTPAPWTLPSHASMFTGLAPSEHGLTNGFVDRSCELPEEFETVAQRLSSSGYRTAGFSNNPWVGSLSGLHRGFDEFVEWDLEITSTSDQSFHTTRERLMSTFHTVFGTIHRQPAFLLKRRFFTSQLIDRAIRWLDESAMSRQPSFTFLNLMEAHSPYFPPRSSFKELNLPAPGPIEPRLLNTKLLAYVMDRYDLDPTQRERILEYYDASVRYQDRKVGELLDHLYRTNQFDETLVVICSDHGKTLGEHDRSATPPHYLRRINTDVPLLIRPPGQRSGRCISTPVELTNLFDLFLAGGVSPEVTLSTEGFALIEDYHPHTGRESTDVTCWRALADGEYRYIRSDSGEDYLFQHGELIEEADSFHEWMGAALDERIDQMTFHEKTSATQTTIGSAVEQQLTDLGYLE